MMITIMIITSDEDDDNDDDHNDVNPGVTSQLGSTQKKSVLGDTGAAKLFEKATELRSSLDVPSFRVPIVRDEETKDSVSLPSSPMSSRKIGLSYMTPPSSRKMGSCRSPTAKESSPAGVSVTCELVWPAPGSSSPPSASVKTVKTSISRSSSPGPFTSVLKSGSLGEDAVNKVSHEQPAPMGSNEHGSPAVRNLMRYHGLLRPYFSLTLPTRQYLKTNYTVPCSNLLFKYFTCQEANLESISY